MIVTENKQPLDKHDENTDLNQEQADTQSGGSGIGAGIADRKSVV